jgi:hypothetical protein
MQEARNCFLPQRRGDTEFKFILVLKPKNSLSFSFSLRLCSYRAKMISDVAEGLSLREPFVVKTPGFSLRTIDEG